MNTWYVRPDTSHSTTRDGTTYATAWGGWFEVVWGSSKVIAGDTLYVCGAHNIGAVAAIGNHGATASARVTIRGDYASDAGSMVIAAGSFYLNINRSYTTLLNLTIRAGTGSCIVVTGAPSTGVTIQGCTFYGSAASMIVILPADGWAYIDTTITSNTFLNNSGGGGGAAIQWYPQTAITTTLSNLQITNNTFTDCSAARAVILLKAFNAVLSGTKMSDVVVSSNAFTDCGGVAMEIYGPEVFGRNTGIQVAGNIIRNQQPVNGLGGGMAIGGFGPSLTASFGANIISGNKGYVLHGPTGMLNLFYGSYIAHDNYCEDLTTDTIDGSGILFDHGNNNCVAFSNHFRRLRGVDGISYSGDGITILDSINIEVFGNLIEDCRTGIHLGNKSAGQSSDIHNNTFMRCGMRGIDVSTAADLTNNLVRNNLFTATDTSVVPVAVATGTFTGDSYNAFHGFGAATGHTLHASDITTDPLIASDSRPIAGSPLIAAGIYIKSCKGADHKTFWNPPVIGAYEYIRPRTTRT